jgi:hypothetical protein
MRLRGEFDSLRRQANGTTFEFRAYGDDDRQLEYVMTAVMIGRSPKAIVCLVTKKRTADGSSEVGYGQCYARIDRDGAVEITFDQLPSL